MSDQVDEAVARELEAHAGLPRDDVPNAQCNGHSGDQQGVARPNGNSGYQHMPSKLAAKLDALVRQPNRALRAEWRRLFKSEPPDRIRRDLLLLAIGWKLQERAFGGLSAAIKRRIAAAANNKEESSGFDTIRLKTGTKLIREWHGVVHEIEVRDDGFVWNGRRYRSLSNIAREITGAHWSGPRFFGLKAKPKTFGRSKGQTDV